MCLYFVWNSSRYQSNVVLHNMIQHRQHLSHKNTSLKEFFRKNVSKYKSTFSIHPLSETIDDRLVPLPLQTEFSHRFLPIFVHIPKTGGRHLNELLESEYGQAVPRMWIHGMDERYRRGKVKIFNFSRSNKCIISFFFVPFAIRHFPFKSEL